MPIIQLLLIHTYASKVKLSNTRCCGALESHSLQRDSSVYIIHTLKCSTLTGLSKVECFFSSSLRWLRGRSECADGRSRGRSGAGREGWGGRVTATPAAKEEAAEEPHQLHTGADRCPGERCDSKRWLKLSFPSKIISVLQRIDILHMTIV